jgi:AraC-like DNA-binding protein
VAKRKDLFLTGAEQQALVLIRAVRAQIAEGSAPQKLRSADRLAHYIITRYHGHVQLRMSRLLPELGVSMRSLQRSFQSTYGTSMKAYQIHARLRFAQYLLATDPALKLSVLSRTLGYEDPNVFVRFFRGQVNASPRAWAEANAAPQRSLSNLINETD